MFTTHELYDLCFLITKIRNDVKDETNIYVLEHVVALYRNEKSEIDSNRLRKLMLSLNICGDKWHVLQHENRYSQEAGFSKNEEQNKFLIVQLDELKKILIDKKYEQAYDLADALHIYPEIIASNLGKNVPRSYWIHVYNPYKKKWNVK